MIMLLMTSAGLSKMIMMMNQHSEVSLAGGKYRLLQKMMVILVVLDPSLVRSAFDTGI